MYNSYLNAIVTTADREVWLKAHFVLDSPELFLLQFLVLSIALTRPGTSLPVVRERTLIKEV
jgi:hypothetical protein